MTTTTTKPRVRGPEPKPGVYEGMSNDEYHALDAVQASHLKKCMKSPRVARAWQQGELPDEKKASLFFGTAVHAALLEPARYRALAVEVDGLKPKAQAATFAKAEEAHPGKIILAEGWREQIETIMGCVAANERAASLLGPRDGATHYREIVVVWECERTGLLMKARLDQLTVSINHPPVLVDIKTTTCEDAEEFASDCWHLGYDIQMAHNEEAVKYAMKTDERFAAHPGPVEHAFIAIHLDPLIDVAAYDLPEDAFVGIGRIRRTELLAAWARCVVSGKYHGAAGPSGRRELPLPGWALARFADGGAA